MFRELKTSVDVGMIQADETSQDKQQNITNPAVSCLDAAWGTELPELRADL